MASLMSCFLNKTVIYFKPIQPVDEIVEVQTINSKTPRHSVVKLINYLT